MLKAGLTALMIWPLLAAGTAAAAGEEARQSDVIGVNLTYTADGKDTLLDLARLFGLGFVELRAANPSVDPWLPGAGTAIVVPSAHVLPEAERNGLVLNLTEMRLYYFPKGAAGQAYTFPIGVGRDGWETPIGRTSIVRKKLNPSWTPTARMRAEDPTLPAHVGPGPQNPLGDRALYLGWATYLIHGTNKPYGVGRRVSRGCIRLYPEHIAALFEMVPPGTSVQIVDQPVKVGWHEGELYLEVHPTLEQADAIERGAPAPMASTDGVVEKIVRAAGAAQERLDWAAVHVAVTERNGVPIRVTKPQI